MLVLIGRWFFALADGITNSGTLLTDYIAPDDLELLGHRDVLAGISAAYFACATTFTALLGYPQGCSLICFGHYPGIELLQFWNLVLAGELYLELARGALAAVVESDDASESVVSLVMLTK